MTKNNWFARRHQNRKFATIPRYDDYPRCPECGERHDPKKPAKCPWRQHLKDLKKQKA